MARKLIDLAGKVFGKLTVKSRAENIGNMSGWNCLCECGTQTKVSGGHLKSGHTTSCGCARNIVTKHGKNRIGKRDRVYSIWSNMIQRCSNPNVPNYDNYGGRGITVCEEWRDFIPFYKWAIDNGYKDGLQIDRKDNDGNYTPDNCRWATRRENSSNTRRSIKVTHDGETHTAKEWSEILDIPYHVIQHRIKAGRTPEETLTK